MTRRHDEDVERREHVRDLWLLADEAHPCGDAEIGGEPLQCLVLRASATYEAAPAGSAVERRQGS